MKSIALIGMPGCGKSTAGKLIAEKLNYTFLDMDSLIEEHFKATIKELFSISEEHFRDCESKVCQILSSREQTVISTGGGVVKRANNIELLKKNCIVVFIDRNVDDILSDIDFFSRPLLAKDHRENLMRLYDERYELYNKCCDFSVKNDSSLEELVKKIISKLHLNV